VRLQLAGLLCLLGLSDSPSADPQGRESQASSLPLSVTILNCRQWHSKSSMYIYNQWHPRLISEPTAVAHHS
jgi:hypothetical protein